MLTYTPISDVDRPTRRDPGRLSSRLSRADGSSAGPSRHDDPEGWQGPGHADLW